MALVIKNSVPHKKLNISKNITLKAIGIKLQSGINVISVYRRPNIILKQQDLNELMRIGDKVLVVGDMNATYLTWNCNRNNKSCRVLLHYTQNNNCTIMYPNEPTNYPPNNSTPSILDIAINKNIRNISDLQVQHELSSDHNPIVFYLGAQHKTQKTRRLCIYEEAD